MSAHCTFNGLHLPHNTKTITDQFLIHHCDKAELPTDTTTNMTCSSPSASEHEPQAFQYQRKIEAKYADSIRLKQTSSHINIFLLLVCITVAICHSRHFPVLYF